MVGTYGKINPATPKLNLGAKQGTPDMGKMIAYMVTWTTYGSWLQGDKRGYVRDGETFGENQALHTANVKRLEGKPAELTSRDRQIVREAILNKADSLGQKIYALAVCSNHVHLVVEHVSEPVEMIVSYYKNAARLALKASGFVGRVWTRGFDKRFCFDRRQLAIRVRYVQAHPRV